MKTILRKWGSSLGITLPYNLVKSLNLKEKSELHIEVKPEGILLKKSAFTLEELLAGITKENLHAETCTGKITGKEIW